MEKGDLVTLRYFSSQPEAGMYAALLEENGIEVFLKGEYMNDVFPIGGFTDIELQVFLSDKQRAEEIFSAKFDEKEFDWESKIK